MDIQKKINLFKDQLLLARDPAQFNEICSSFFNYNYTSVEEKLTNSSADPQLYLNEQLREEALNTSWYDYYQLIKYSKNQVLDVGSGYSKGTLLALTLGYKNFYSVEFVPERIQWAKIKAQELDLDTSFFFSGDALNIDFSKYKIFLVYQPTGRFLTRFLNSLTQFENKEIWAIESHGDLIHRLDLDSRLIDKRALLELSAKRHHNTIYSFKSKNTSLCPILEFENSLYREKYIEVDDYNSIFGHFSWVSSTQEAFIDYIDGISTLELNKKRIPLKDNLGSLKFIKKLNSFQESYINKNHLFYNNKNQRILKVISSPEDSLELSSSGKVTIN